MVDEAIVLLANILSGMFQPNIVIYKIILGLCKAYRVEDPIEKLATIIENGCQPNKTIYMVD